MANGFIKRKIPWTALPNVAVRVDKSHPIGRNIVGAYLFNGIVNGQVKDLSGNGNHINIVGSPVAEIVNGKRGLTFSGTGQYGYIDPGILTGAVRRTVAGGFVVTDTDNIFCSVYGWNGGATDFQVYATDTALQARSYNTTFTALVNETSDILDNEVDFVYADSAINTAAFYTKTGHSRVKSSNTDDARTMVETRKFLVGTDADALGTDGDGSLGNWFTGTMFYLFIIGNETELSDYESTSLREKPWQVFEPRTQIIPIEYGAGSPITNYLTLTFSGVGSSAALDTIATHVITVPVTAAGSSTISKLISKYFSPAAVGSPTIVKKVAKTLPVGATGASSYEDSLELPVTSTYTATGTLSTVATFIAAGAAPLINFVRRIAIRLGLGL